MNSDSGTKDTSTKPYYLTPSEIESLRQDAKQASKILDELIAAGKRVPPTNGQQNLLRPDHQNNQEQEAPNGSQSSDADAIG